MKNLLIGIISVAFAVASTIAHASPTPKQTCQDHQAMIDGRKHEFPKDLGGDQKRYLDSAEYDASKDLCTITLRFRVPYQLFVDTVKEVSGNDSEHLARKFLEGKRGKDFISKMLTLTYGEDYQFYNRPGVNVVMNLSFTNNGHPRMSVPLFK